MFFEFNQCVVFVRDSAVAFAVGRIVPPHFVACSADELNAPDRISTVDTGFRAFPIRAIYIYCKFSVSCGYRAAACDAVAHGITIQDTKRRSMAVRRG